MAEEVIEVEADSLKSARKRAKKQVPSGLSVLSEEVLSDGNPVSVSASAPTSAQAFAKVERSVPGQAEVLTRRVISEATRHHLSISAFGQQEARQIALQGCETGVVQGTKLVTAGRRGFLGLARKPSVYQLDVLKQAVVEVTYRTRPRIRLTVGKTVADEIAELQGRWLRVLVEVMRMEGLLAKGEFSLNDEPLRSAIQLFEEAWPLYSRSGLLDGSLAQKDWDQRFAEVAFLVVAELKRRRARP